MGTTVNKTPLPIIAGVLDIVHAVFGFLCFIGLLIAIIAVSVTGASIYYGPGWGAISVPLAVLWSMAIPCVVSTILSLIGGIYAIQRKKWGLALAGSIAAIFPTFIFGVAAVVLVALSKDEFE